MNKTDPIPITIIDHKKPAASRLSSDERIVIVPDTINDRYASFQFIPWWEQERLRQATIMVVGVGALGNEVLKNLAMLGIGRLVIVDFDLVEPGNLSRSILFRAQDSGRPKTEVAAAAIRDINPDVHVDAIQGDVTLDVGLGLFRRMDVIIGCLDNREARLFLNQAAHRLDKPWVDGAIQELLGIARVFWPGRGACYECILTPADWQAIESRYSCSLLNREKILTGKVPTTPTIASIIAAVQTQEALKLLHGLEVQAGCGFVFNGLTNESYTVRYPVRDDCLGHEDPYVPIVELPWASSGETTVSEILQVARHHLGSEAHLELDYELVTHLYCNQCQENQQVLQPMRRLESQQLTCPRCYIARRPMTTHTIHGSESFLNAQLNLISIPDLHIITARNDHRVAYFELTGN